MNLPETLSLLIAADPILVSLSSLVARGRHADAYEQSRSKGRGFAGESRIAFLALRAEIALGLGRFATCLELATEILGLKTVVGDIERHVENILVRALLGLGRLGDVEARIEARVPQARSTAFETSLIRARIAIKRGDLTLARRMAEDARALALAARNRPEIVEALLVKARVERESGDLRAARHDLDRAHRLSNGLRNPASLAEALSERADLLAHSGEWTAAAADAAQSGRLFARTASPHEHLCAGRRTGLIGLAKGEPQAALLPIARASDLLRRGFGTSECRAEIDLLIADAHLAAQDPHAALESATAALSLFNDSGDVFGRARAHVRRSLASLASSNVDAALREAKRASSLSNQSTIAGGLADLALGRALLRVERERAAEPFEQARRNESLYPPLRSVAEIGAALASGVAAQSDVVRAQLQAIETFGDRRILTMVRRDLHELFGLENSVPSEAPVVPDGAGADEQPAGEIGEFLPGLLGSSSSVVALGETVRKAARSELRVAIYGETGTGKENVARAIHSLSARRHRPFVAVNAATSSDELFESEFFGHVRGAFTGATTDRKGHVESANGGTLFIDEIGDLSPRAQVKVLRFLETGMYRRVGESREQHADVRVVVATNRRLEDLASEGRFRADLMYRLRGIALEIPALRDRGSDVVRLARHFVSSASEGSARLSPLAEGAIRKHSWPGNVREMKQEMERAVVLAETDVISWSLPSTICPGPAMIESASLRHALIAFERTFVQDALLKHGGKADVARALGVSRQALHQKIARYGL